MLEIELGSILQLPPEESYTERAYSISKWIYNEPGMSITITKKKYIPIRNQIFDFLDSLKGPTELVDDAKRIAFDIERIGNEKPSTLALVALYLACELHQTKFGVCFIKFYEKGENWIYIDSNIRRRSLNKSTMDVFVHRIKKKAQAYKKLLGEEKFEALKKMRGELCRLKVNTGSSIEEPTHSRNQESFLNHMA